MKTRARAPLTREEVIRRLRELLPEVQQRYGVRSLWLFGSYARGSPRKSSDIDVLVEFEQLPSLFKLIELQLYIGDLLGAKVDLVTKSGLRPSISGRVLSEAILV